MIEVQDVDGEAMQKMKWWHGKGEQRMTVKGVVRKSGITSDEKGEDFGYFDTVSRLASNCSVM